MLHSILEETCVRAGEVEAALLARQSVHIEVPPELMALILAASVGRETISPGQRERLVAWAGSVIEAFDLASLDHDTLRHLVGLRRRFGRGGSFPATPGRTSE